jgi:hypothetical protein
MGDRRWEMGDEGWNLPKTKDQSPKTDIEGRYCYIDRCQGVGQDLFPRRLYLKMVASLKGFILGPEARYP